MVGEKGAQKWSYQHYEHSPKLARQTFPLELEGSEYIRRVGNLLLLRINHLLYHCLMTLSCDMNPELQNQITHGADEPPFEESC